MNKRQTLRPHLIVVLPSIPYPLNQGYRIVAFNDLEQLSRYYSLDIIIWQVDRNFDIAAIEELLKRIDARLFKFHDATKYSKTILEKIVRNIKDSVTFKSFFVPDGVGDLIVVIKEAMHNIGTTQVFFEMSVGLFAHAALFLQKKQRVETLFMLQNIESKSFFSGKKVCLKGIKKIAILYWKVREWFELKDELNALRSSWKVFTMAYSDHVFLNKRSIRNVFIPPLMSVGSMSEKTDAMIPAIGVLGDLSEESSGGGMASFVNTVIPSVLKNNPSAKFRIVGKGMSMICYYNISKYSNVTFQEYVDNIDDFWNSISILAVPILVDRGIRIRILESACRNIPVVATPESVTGFKNPSEFIMVRKIASFADAIECLLKDKKAYGDQVKKSESYSKDNLSNLIIEKEWKKVFSHGMI